MKKYFVVILVLAAITFALESCRKESTALLVTDLSLASDDVSDAETLVQDAEDISDQDIETRNLNNNCPTVTFANPQGTFPNTITVDFGTDGCTGQDGRVRKGIITINLTDSLVNPGAQKTVTLSNYYVDNIHIEGTKTVTNNGLVNGNPSFTKVVTGAKITFTDGTSTQWESNHTWTQTAGFNTYTVFDNEFSVTGNANGVTRNGKVWAGEILTPLVHKTACPWIVSGVRQITVNDKTATIDYSYGYTSGGCDRKALVTLPNGQTRIINIH